MGGFIEHVNSGDHYETQGRPWVWEMLQKG